MLYNIKWAKKPYYRFNNLKSINVDHKNESLDIVLYINDKKEYTYNLKAEEIEDVKLCINYNKSMDKVVFFMIIHKKNNKKNMISFYLPRRYDKELVADIKNFAQNSNIPFKISKALNPLVFVSIVIIMFFLIKYFVL